MCQETVDMKEVLDVLKKKEAEIKESIDSCKTVGV